ncbi:MBL fold metallo-hydrolase [Aromatoleum aromaticum]|uniref:Metallo-beta-lactamase family protein n=1 Tax=Aromatoleum aromaticum (strain DSM 19018 / LMG 30748 / EbN1) TaxID=76114 RepID=Q5P4W3_AROAE|nr:MBL fold metallo-hydrolase [Aromatoleum aromaticum]NMG55288.1 MBL fold metallo-hydrolase [Aromatoleum aromaticum]CAI07649.1 putative metallo-beta-lactamase family protein [Aromatoleum aromaticum EbN1]
MIDLRIVPVTPFEQNCSIVWCDKTRKAAVVDPGGDLERILAKAKELGVTIEKILITHGHIDHAGGTAQLARELGVPVEGPEKADLFWITGIPQQARTFGFPGAESFEPDRWLHDGDTVTVGDETLRVIHVPGHTPGHVAFFHADARLAIVGDVLFAGSIGRTDFPQGDHATLIRSIRQKLFPLGDDITFVPGHGPTSTFGEERRSNPYVGDHA